MADVGIIGRESERSWLRSLVSAARSGHSSVNVVEGDPGIGKTALLTAAAQEIAVDAVVVQCAGIEAEVDLSFAALQRIVMSNRSAVESLPIAQRSSLMIATGLEEGIVGDRVSVGMGLLSLLSALSDHAPVFVWIDDAHWVDEDSLAIFAFVARRVLADRIVVVFTCRPDHGESVHLAGFPVRRLEGLDVEYAIDLLSRGVGRVVERQVAVRIADATGGNPLALLDLGAELTQRQLGGASVLPDPVPVGAHLQDHYARQVRALPEDSRRWLLLAATEPDGDPGLIAAAARADGIDADASSPPERAHLVTSGDRVVFRHPLIRSAVYGDATREERRSAHLALARVADEAGAAMRALLHRAAAVDGVDAELAADLEVAAADAAARANIASRARLLIRAAHASPAEDRPRRLLNAAEATIWAGATAQTRALLAEIDARQLDEAGRLSLEMNLEALRMMSLGDDAFAGQSIAFLRFAEVLDRHGRHEEAVASASMAVRYSWMSREFTEGTDDEEIARFTLALTEDDEPSPLVCSLRSLAELLAGDPERGIALYEETVDQFANRVEPGQEYFLGFTGVVQAAGVLQDDVSRDRVMHALQVAAATSGVSYILANTVSFRAHFDLQSGRLASGRAGYDEASVLLSLIGYPDDYVPMRAMHAAIRGWTADSPISREEMEEATVECRRLAYGSGVTQWRRAWLTNCIAAGDYDQAWTVGELLAKNAENADGYLVADLIEVATALGDTATASRLRLILEHRGRRFASVTSAALESWADVHLGVDPDAGLRATELFREARSPMYRARAHLALGEELRRTRRRAGALEHFRSASDIFDDEGARVWSERASRELAGLGIEHERRPSHLAGLTPQEATVARLAADGETNSVIAGKLFISPSTVDYHLRKVFRKLDVTSRRQLRAALSR